ncbi:hypothetical protein MUB24_11765 [Lederbergia sp. NSJ-179]|uniref:hypothetical protein n=1 Tax=Lederbergia sp. NSJ-179 TaxID=2931402 RepID=UPI001FD4A834|nr:hypothetical protein [Lederbergia sp. NSJ-179]MCJ7841559.1 hypothetical protein [Lederbergia sp. NSJ-179]
MNRRTQCKQIKNWIHKATEAAQLPMRIKQRQSGVNMSYHFLENFIGFNPKRLIQSHREMREAVALKAFVQALTLHELGHFLDRKALLASIPKSYHIYQIKKAHTYSERCRNIELFQWDIEDHEMNYRFEETAWLNAHTLNQRHSIVESPIMDQVQFNSLLTYTAPYNRDLLIYYQLKTAMLEPVAV